MTHRAIITSELKKMGFETVQFSNGVVAMLKNRKVSQAEVKHALADAFGGIEFSLKNTTHGVLVS